MNIENNEEYKLLLVSSRTLMDNKQFYIKEFDNNYYYNFKSDFRFFKFIEIYVRTRILNMRVFKNDMEEITNVIGTDKLPAYKRMLTEEYWKIPEDEFSTVVDETLETVKNGEIRLIDIVKLYAYFAFFVQKDLIKYDIDTIKNVFFSGMNLSSLTSEYCDNVREELAQIAIDEASVDMTEILKHFTELNSKLKDKMYIELAEEIFKLIPMKMEVFFDKFEKQCMNIPIFKYYDEYQLFQRVSCASNEDIVTIRELLIKRAENFSSEIKPELENIIRFKKIIDEYVYGKPKRIKIVMLEDLSKDLEYVLEKMQK